MKAKKQKLLSQFFKYLAKDGTVMNHSKEEAQQVLDRFIDHQDSKKKSKFGSDKEVVKLKEKTFEEWKEIFPIGSKARVVGNSEKEGWGTHEFKIGEIVEIKKHAKGENNSFHCKNQNHSNFWFVLPCDLEPIQETKFKVGDMVQTEVRTNGNGNFNRKGIIVDAADVEHKVYFFDNGNLHFVKIEKLKLLPND